MKAIQSLPLVFTLVLAACTSASPTAPSAGTPTGAMSPPLSTGVPESRGPVSPPNPSPTPGQMVSPTPVMAVDGPPQGALGHGDVADVGWLGSFCWNGTCGDVPAVPPKSELPEVVVPGESLIFSLDEGEFVRWIAQYGPNGASLMTLAEGGDGFDPDAMGPSPDMLLEWVQFEAPPPGDWLVTVQAFFVGGDASYYWHVRVE